MGRKVDSAFRRIIESPEKGKPVGIFRCGLGEEGGTGL
jgi:hypothetical protein